MIQVDEPARINVVTVQPAIRFGRTGTLRSNSIRACLSKTKIKFAIQPHLSVSFLFPTTDLKTSKNPINGSERGALSVALMQ